MIAWILSANVVQTFLYWPVWNVWRFDRTSADRQAIHSSSSSSASAEPGWLPGRRNVVPADKMEDVDPLSCLLSLQITKNHWIFTTSFYPSQCQSSYREHAVIRTKGSHARGMQTWIVLISNTLKMQNASVVLFERHHTQNSCSTLMRRNLWIYVFIHAYGKIISFSAILSTSPPTAKIIHYLRQYQLNENSFIAWVHFLPIVAPR